MTRSQMNALADLLRIPSVDMPIAGELLRLEYKAVDDLRGRDPEAIFDAFCALKGKPMDRFYLYVFRSAVAFAENPEAPLADVRWDAHQD